MLLKTIPDAVILATVIVFATVVAIIKHQDQLLAVTDISSVGSAYSQSQYVLGDKAVQKIDDGTLYQYAAHAYLQGDDPTTINFEHPPLGKYIYGVSLWLTQRVHVGNVLVYTVCLILFARLLTHFKLPLPFSLLALIHLALASSLDQHLSSVLLDLQTLFWSLLFFVVLLTARERPIKYFWVGVSLGGFIATKYFFPIVFLYTGLVLLWAWKKKNLPKVVITGITAISIYVASYALYFYHGHSLLDFVKFEWYRFRWWTGDRTIPQFIIMSTLFLGKFPMWWESGSTYMRDNHWNITWPLLFTAHLFSSVGVSKKLETLVIWLFSIGLLAIFLFGSAVYGRYLLQLMPFWWITIGLALYARKNHT